MRIERGEHMSYSPKFEDIEARPPRLSSRWRAGMAVGPRANSQGLWLVTTLVIGHWGNCDKKLEVLIRRQTWSLFVFFGM